MRKQPITHSMARPHGCQWTVVMLQALVFYCMIVPFNEAFASGTIGDVINKTARNYNTLPIVMNYISIIAGLVVIVVGLQKLYKHVERPDQIPLAHGLWHLAGGTFLFSLPAAWAMMARSLELFTASGSTLGASNIALKVAPGTPLGLDVMMIRLIQNIRGPMALLLWSLSAILGLFFMITAFLRMARGAAQDGPRGSVGSGTIVRVLIGSILLSLAATADVFTTTMFSGSIKKFDGMVIPGIPAAGLDQANQAMSAILIFVQILGFIAFMRGFLMLRSLADGNTSVSSAAAFTHILGGAAAINISPVLLSLQNTFCGGGAGCTVFNFT